MAFNLNALSSQYTADSTSFSILEEVSLDSANYLSLSLENQNKDL